MLALRTTGPHAYTQLMRTLQSNLKAFAGGRDQAVVLFDELAFHLLLDHHQQLEHLSLKQQFHVASSIASSVLHQPHTQSLRALPVSYPALSFILAFPC